MSVYVRVSAGEVFERVETDGDITEMFHPSMVFVCIDGIEPPPLEGWQAVESGGAWRFSPPDAPVMTPEQLAALVAAERFKREATGVLVDGLSIETTRDSQALIASTGLAAIYDPEYRCNFKTAAGFVEIGSAEIVAIATAVRSHVQACFDRELELRRLIETGEYRDEMLHQGWPAPTPPDPPELQ
ncbi:DUF4376 domain-containing protein [Pseudomonas sp. R16(2017)]|uniref:DUF4376 domain-containing protein n=1 Tax=Pseudomonas sp. R16(2017) TaxID=1981704 RepID=UPI0021145B24|nr:DUF4376 domain-containing protein [Pseudomonas sp. R16(2017)]